MAKKKTKSAETSTLSVVESALFAEPIALSEESNPIAQSETLNISSEPLLQSQYEYQQTYQNERNDFIMSCKSAIYTANTASTVVSVGSAVPLGSIIRRFGCGVSYNGNAISLNERGYYDIDVGVTFTAADAGNVTITVYQDGVAVPGATATATITIASTQVESITVPAIVRVLNSCAPSQITVVVSGTAATFSNVAVTVEKL